MDERYNRPQSHPPVRRRRKKVPKWKRMLRKYWPPIRFGLVVIGLVALVWWGASSLVSGIRTAIRDSGCTCIRRAGCKQRCQKQKRNNPFHHKPMCLKFKPVQYVGWYLIATDILAYVPILGIGSECHRLIKQACNNI